MARRATSFALGLALAAPALAAAQTAPPPPPPTRQNPPVPRPFPGVKPPAPPAAPEAPEVQDPVTGELMVGNAPVYPAAERLDEFDAGRGQRFVIFGTNLPYDDIVNYYKTTLRNNGREIFREPAMQQFELGRFDDDTMAYPPSVVVKDYSWGGSAGYLHIDGTTEKRYRTIIQIVVGPGAGG